MPQGCELFLRLVGVENGSVKVDYQVVKYQGDHGEHCLSSPEVIDIKGLKGVALFEIFDDILIVGTRTIASPDLLW